MYRLLFWVPVCLILVGVPLGFLMAPAFRGEAPVEPTIATEELSQEPLPVADPVAFLEQCLKHYDASGIEGYALIMRKQERIGGVLQPSEEIQVVFRAHPYSVFMRWLRGERRAAAALYVEGKNGGKMLIHPSGIAGKLVKVVERDPEGEDARQAGRYSIKEFGLRKTLVRTLNAWKDAQEEGRLQVRYLGVRKVHEAGDRPCYTLRRTNDRPGSERIAETTVYIDKEKLLQVGTVLKDKDGRLVGEYMFRDIHINPKLKPDQFEPAALTE